VPVVSVIVVTYNSSPFIIETLSSVSNQTWKEIELIITDDFSSDDTVDICRRWLNQNSHFFVKATLLHSGINTGVSANANRGLKAAQGDWVKFLGGDDTLKPGCIEENMFWIASYPEIRALFSRIDIYSNIFEAHTLLETTKNDSLDPKSIMNSGRSAYSQYKMLLVADRIHYTPSVFLHRETLNSVGGFDERFKMIEDYPLWLNLTKNGHKLHFMDTVTVNYRQHSKAINNTGRSYLINPNYFISEAFRKVYTYPYLPLDIKLYQKYYWVVSQIFRWDWLNRNRKLNRVLLNVLTSYLNPFKYYTYFNKKIHKELKYSEYYM